MHTFNLDVYGINQTCYYSGLDEWHIILRNAGLSKTATNGKETVSQVESETEKRGGSKEKKDAYVPLFVDQMVWFLKMVCLLLTRGKQMYDAIVFPVKETEKHIVIIVIWQLIAICVCICIYIYIYIYIYICI